MGKGTWPNAWASGVAASRPDPEDVGVGAYYYATDTGVLSQSDGVSTWTTIETFAGVAGGTDVAVADGGTGASTASAAATNLGLGTGDSPQFTAVNIGHASDTTLARASAGNLTVEGNALYRAGGTDVPIADGGTGASTKAAAFDALSPMTTAGDIIIGGASGTGTRLAAGATSGHVLTSNGSGVAPSYQAAAGGSALTVKDEGSNLDTAVTSIDFVGAGVVATNASHAVTVTISGGGGGGSAAIGAKAYSATTQSISGSTLTAVTFGSEEFDTDGFHDTGSNTSRMTVPAGLGGKYLLTAGTKWVTGSPTFCEVAFRLNGSTLIRGGNATVSNTNNGFFSMATTAVDLAAGDYVEFVVYQTTGTLSIGDGSGNHDAESNFSILKLDSGKVGAGIGCRVHASGVQNIANGATASLTFDTEDFDTDGFHSTVTNTSRMTIPAGLGGKYLIQGGSYSGAMTSATASYAYLNIAKNGTAVWRNQKFALNNGSGIFLDVIPVSTILDLAAGDYVEVEVNNGDGTSARDFGHASAAHVQSWLSVMRLDSGSAATAPTAHAVDCSRTSDQSVGNATFTAIAWSATDIYDTDAMHDPASNNTRVTIPTISGVTTGLWELKAFGYMDANRVDIKFRKNGSTDYDLIVGNASGLPPFFGSMNVVLAAADYVEVLLRTTLGAGNLIGSDSTARPHFQVTFLGKVT